MVFTPCTSAQSNQTVVEPGTYYMACKDTSGNRHVYQQISLKITLDYGDATCPVQLHRRTGRKHRDTSNQKLGYTFEGWEQTE